MLVTAKLMLPEPLDSSDRVQYIDDALVTASCHQAVPLNGRRSTVRTYRASRR